MKEGILKSQSIIPRIDGIKKDLEKLKTIGESSLEEFKQKEEFFALAQFYLRQALEGVFHIGEHILSRLNGGRATEYKEIAKLLGEKRIVDKNFADTKLIKMAGYRNRLTHFYAEITSEEIYKIIKEDLGDFDTFLVAVKKLLQNPEEFGFKIE